jgi:hypothetical protein
MGKIIRIQFRRSRLSRRLVRDGWWLETPAAPAAVIAFPKCSTRKLASKARHLTLVKSGN